MVDDDDGSAQEPDDDGLAEVLSERRADFAKPTLAILDGLLTAAALRQRSHNEVDEAFYASRYVEPWDHDPLIDWLETENHQELLVAIADKALPGRVTRIAAKTTLPGSLRTCLVRLVPDKG